MTETYITQKKMQHTLDQFVHAFQAEFHAPYRWRWVVRDDRGWKLVEDLAFSKQRGDSPKVRIIGRIEDFDQWLQNEYRACLKRHVVIDNGQIVIEPYRDDGWYNLYQLVYVTGISDPVMVFVTKPDEFAAIDDLSTWQASSPGFNAIGKGLTPFNAILAWKEMIEYHYAV